MVEFISPKADGRTFDRKGCEYVKKKTTRKEEKERGRRGVVSAAM